MSYRRVNYPDLEDFSVLLFAIVNEQYNQDPTNPLPDYSKEDPSGLQTVLEHAKNDDYYPTLEEKASYIFTSIIVGHSYSNGNKRLALVTMLYFLAINGCNLPKVEEGELKNLALRVADSKRNKGMDFNQLKEYVLEFLRSKISKAFLIGRRIYREVRKLKRLGKWNI